MVETRFEQARALLLALGGHVGLIALVVWSSLWVFPTPEDSPGGPPIQATLMVSAADLKRAEKAIKNSESLKPDVVQPLPSPKPQTSDIALQETPQAPLDRPDTTDQQAVNKLGETQAEEIAREQEEKRRQAQVDLTQDIIRQKEVESRQRLREQLDAIRLEREKAQRNTRMEEQRLKQLADLPAVAKPVKSATPAKAGASGPDQGLHGRYVAALNATARANWITASAPEQTRCTVRFTQIPGGEVIDVEFLECPYDAQARDSVDRALRKSPMPYTGFETVYQRKIILTLCYPEEACQR